MSRAKQLSFSICIPVYRGSHVLTKALDSVFKQKFTNFEILIGDDNLPSSTAEIGRTKKLLASYHSKKIKYFKNKVNLGYPLNLRSIVSRAKNDVIFLLAQDDILSQKALQETHDAFFAGKNIGVVTRPYFWFHHDINHPVRSVEPPNKKKSTIMSVFGSEAEFVKIFESVGQLSGLAYLRKYLTIPFNEEIFPAHIYPFAGILKNHRCVFLPDYTVAVGIEDSQTRSLSSIYNQSPTESWLKMYQTVFSGPKFLKQRQWGVKHMATHFEGLVQIKNYSKDEYLLREIGVMVKSRWQNLFNIRFWFYSLITIFVPRGLLIKITDWYKSTIMAKKLEKIEFSL